MTRRRFVLGVGLPSMAVLLLAGAVVSYQMRKPPLETLRQAMDSLETARAAQAERWAGSAFQKAQWHLRAGEEAMKEVSADWWPFGSYHEADSLLAQSIHLSNLAASQARTERAHRRVGIEGEVAGVVDSVRVWREILDGTLPRTEDELLYRSASFSALMAQDLVRRKQYEAADEYLDSVRILLGVLRERRQQWWTSHQKRVQQSQVWAAETVKASRNSGGTAIIVDKSLRRLYVLSAGKVVDSSTCDLGYNSGHQKRVAGDGATPEGMYAITTVKYNSKFYRALLLDYPNAEDRKRFQANISAGVIAAESKIGGLIEIHGHGGTGRDWTDGCVAVTDRDMDKLFRLASVGTPVAILRAWKER